MRIAVVGATGRTGRLVVEQALAAGHSVIAVARRPPGPPAAGNLEWRQADVLDSEAVQRVLPGAEAVAICLGPGDAAPRAEDRAARVCGEGTKNVVAAMRALGIDRVSCVTGAMIGHPPERLAWILRRIRARFSQAYPAAAADREAQEQALLQSGLRVAIIRPSRLVDGPVTPRLLSAGAHVPSLAATHRADLAAALLEALEPAAQYPAGAVLLSRPRLDRRFLSRWTASYALAELAGLGLVGLVAASARQQVDLGWARAVLAVAAGGLEGLIVGAALGAVLVRARPELRFGRFVSATVAGALTAWVLGSVPMLLGGERDSGAPGPLVQLTAAAALGLLAGPILGAFQGWALRPAHVRVRRWLAANALGWMLGMPLVFVAAGRGWVAAQDWVIGPVCLLLAGAAVGLLTGLALVGDPRVAAGTAASASGPM